MKLPHDLSVFMLNYILSEENWKKIEEAEAKEEEEEEEEENLEGFSFVPCKVCACACAYLYMSGVTLFLEIASKNPEFSWSVHIKQNKYKYFLRYRDAWNQVPEFEIF